MQAPEPSSTSLIGANPADAWRVALSTKLARRTGAHVLLSYNHRAEDSLRSFVEGELITRPSLQPVAAAEAP